VVEALPGTEFGVEFGRGLRSFFEERVELVVIGFRESFEEAVLFGAVGRREKVGEGLGASLLKATEERGAVVGVEVLEGEGKSLSNLAEEAFGRLGSGGDVGPEHPEAGRVLPTFLAPLENRWVKAWPGGFGKMDF